MKKDVQEPSRDADLLGMYRHFKGGLYELQEIALCSETMQKMVIYRAHYGEKGLWVRPYGMFFETVTREGKTMPRFEKITPSS